MRQMNDQPEFTYKADVEYQQFFGLVQTHCEAVLSSTKLYGLWFVSKTFLTHWKSSDGSDGSMLWSAFRLGWARDEGMALIQAWWECHGMSKNENEFDSWKEAVLNVKWKESQALLEKEKMEKRKTKLTYKIQEALKAGPSTNDLLAKALGQSAKAVESCTFRMARAGEVKKLRRGVYADLEYVESRPGADQVTAAATIGSRLQAAPIITAAPVNHRPDRCQEQDRPLEEIFTPTPAMAKQQPKLTEPLSEKKQEQGARYRRVFNEYNLHVESIGPVYFGEMVTKYGTLGMEEAIRDAIQSDDRERIRRETERMERSGHNNDCNDSGEDSDCDTATHGGYPSMAAKSCRTAKAKELPTAFSRYRR
jgi:hypothetical protein